MNTHCTKAQRKLLAHLLRRVGLSFSQAVRKHNQDIEETEHLQWQDKAEISGLISAPLCSDPPAAALREWQSEAHLAAGGGFEGVKSKPGDGEPIAEYYRQEAKVNPATKKRVDYVFVVIQWHKFFYSEAREQSRLELPESSQDLSQDQVSGL